MHDCGGAYAYSTDAESSDHRDDLGSYHRFERMSDDARAAVLAQGSERIRASTECLAGARPRADSVRFRGHIQVALCGADWGCSRIRWIRYLRLQLAGRRRRCGLANSMATLSI